MRVSVSRMYVVVSCLHITHNVVNEKFVVIKKIERYVLSI